MRISWLPLLLTFVAVPAFAQSIPEARELARSVGCTPGAVEQVKQQSAGTIASTYKITCSNPVPAGETAKELLIECQMSLCQVLR